MLDTGLAHDAAMFFRFRSFCFDRFHCESASSLRFLGGLFMFVLSL